MTATRFLLLAVLVAAAAFLAGCARPPVQIPTEVKVEVPVACIRPEERPVRPAVRSEPDLMALGRFQRTLALFSDWLKLKAYVAELEALVEGCARIPVSG